MPRKHKGINQKTGRLNKGYKYSGKKLKSGLKQIVKIQKVKKNQKGGKVLGKGGFGCTIAPSISCGKKLKKFEKRISKITYRTDMSEIVIGEKLKKIDPKGKYLLYIKEHCKITKEQINQRDFEKCNLEDKPLYDNLIMKKGKGSLDIIGKMMDKDAHIKSLYKIICACMLLLKHNYTHFDIKEKNIVIARPRIGMGKYEAYLIDFGGNFLIDSWESFKDNILIFKSGYIFPPEVHSVMPRYIKRMLQEKNSFKVSKSMMLGPLKWYSDSMMKTKTGYKPYMSKVMSYMIGNSFPGNSITRKMKTNDPSTRLSLKEAKDLIEKLFPFVKKSVTFSLN